tara:strand:- start:562 stop:753 length:192 start_codon:yes stop_codon:yes gene_type:complete
MELKDPHDLRAIVNKQITDFIRPLYEQHGIELTKEQELELELLDTILCMEFGIDKTKYPNIPY